MNHEVLAVISGDIVAFTSLTEASKKELEAALAQLFQTLEERFGTFSRLIKGDYLECAVPKAADGLRVALLLKIFIKSQES